MNRPHLLRALCYHSLIGWYQGIFHPLAERLGHSWSIRDSESEMVNECGSNARIVEKSSEAKEVRTDLSLNAKTFEEVI